MSDQWEHGRDEARGNFVLWENDISEDYEMNASALVMRTDGTVFLLNASGCSCWDGDATTDELGSLAQAIDPVTGVPDDLRNDEFHALAVRHDFLEEAGLCPGRCGEVVPKRKKRTKRQPEVTT